MKQCAKRSVLPTPTFTYHAKYGIRNWQGGGRASARETIGRVAAAAIARKVLTTLFPKIEIVAFVTQIHQIVAKIDRSKVKTAKVEASIVRCPDKRGREEDGRFN